MKFRRRSGTTITIHGRYGDFVHASIRGFHQDLNENFANEFAATGHRYFGTDGLSRHFMEQPPLLCCFFAFPKSNVGTQYLKSVSAETYKEHFIQSARDLFLRAAFGEDSINRFDLDEVNLELVKEFCRLGMKSNWGSERYPCHSNCWQLLLQKWAAFVKHEKYLQAPLKEKKKLLRSSENSPKSCSPLRFFPLRVRFANVLPQYAIHPIGST